MALAIEPTALPMTPAVLGLPPVQHDPPRGLGQHVLDELLNNVLSHAPDNISDSATADWMAEQRPHCGAGAGRCTSHNV